MPGSISEERQAMITLTVYGIPGPQGSKSFKGISKKGKAIMVESSLKVKPWREAVKMAFIAKYSGVPRPIIKGPVGLSFVFAMPKPKKSKYKVPATKPDLSKLIRSTEDALTEVGAWEDDSRVVYLAATKVYCGDRFAESMESPGAIITIRERP